jgi:hypothetical protein
VDEGQGLGFKRQRRSKLGFLSCFLIDFAREGEEDGFYSVVYLG